MFRIKHLQQAKQRHGNTWDERGKRNCLSPGNVPVMGQAEIRRRAGRARFCARYGNESRRNAADDGAVAVAPAHEVTNFLGPERSRPGRSIAIFRMIAAHSQARRIRRPRFPGAVPQLRLGAGVRDANHRADVLGLKKRRSGSHAVRSGMILLSAQSSQDSMTLDRDGALSSWHIPAPSRPIRAPQRSTTARLLIYFPIRSTGTTGSFLWRLAPWRSAITRFRGLQLWVSSGWRA